MGAAITLMMNKWVDAHGLTIKEKVAEYISGTNGQQWAATGSNSTSVKIVGITSITLFLVPTLELDVSNTAICSGNF